MSVLKNWIGCFECNICQDGKEDKVFGSGADYQGKTCDECFELYLKDTNHHFPSLK